MNHLELRPSAQGLYNPSNEHDACGVGFVAHIKGKKTHEIIVQGLKILENLDHLEALPKERGTRVLKKEASGPNFNGRANLTLPKLAGQRISSICQEQVIGASRGETRGTKPEHENIPCLMIVVGRLNGRQGEALRGDRNRSRRPWLLTKWNP